MDRRFFGASLDCAAREQVRQHTRLLLNRFTDCFGSVLCNTYICLPFGDSMKYRDGVLGLAGLVAYIITGSIGVIPFKFSTPIMAVIGFITVLYWRDPNFLGFLKDDYNFGSNKKNDLAVDPNDALEWLQNDFIPNHAGKRKLNLDATDSSNKKHYTKIQKVNENGEEKVKFGVIGRPLDMKESTMIAYVVHCDEGWAEYSGELHSSEDRLDPFNGRHQWIKNAGYKAKVEENQGQRSPGGVTVYQGPGNETEGSNQ